MSYYHYLAVEILLLTMAITCFKDSRRKSEKVGKTWYQYIDWYFWWSLWSGGVDIVLWLVVQVVQYLSVPPFSNLPGLSAAPRSYE